MSILAIMIVVAAVLATYHFIVQSVFIPDIRLMMRWRFFATRDRLRELYIESQGTENEIGREAFEIFDSNINGFLKHTHHLDFYFIRNFYERVRQNKELQADLDRRKEVLDAVNSEAFQDLRDRYSKNTFYTCAANSMGDLPEVFLVLCIALPIIGVMKLSKRIYEWLYESYPNAIMAFLLSPFGFVRNTEDALSASTSEELSLVEGQHDCLA